MNLGACIVAVATLAAVSVHAPAKAEDLNDPGSWAYEGCKQGLIAQIKQTHPQVTQVEIDGHVSRDRETDRKERLSGNAKFVKDGDTKKVSFECIVDRDDKQIEKVKYDN